MSDCYWRHGTTEAQRLLWTQPEVWNAPVYYLALHGGPGRVRSVLDAIGSDALCDAFRGYGSYDCLIYFASCGVLRGREGETFARDFLDASGCRAVIGYTMDVDWMPSMPPGSLDGPRGHPRGGSAGLRAGPRARPHARAGGRVTRADPRRHPCGAD